jgi:flagellar basal-body rod protein FlgB
MGLFIDKFLDKTFPGVTKAMDLTWRRNEAISSNIANAETPGYRAVDINFTNELNRAFETGEASSELRTTNAKHMDVSSSSEAHLMPDFSGVTKADGNNVDIDIQMGRLAYNSGKYSTASSIIRKQLTLLKNAIRDARS